MSETHDTVSWDYFIDADQGIAFEDGRIRGYDGPGKAVVTIDLPPDVEEDLRGFLNFRYAERAVENAERLLIVKESCRQILPATRQNVS